MNLALDHCFILVEPEAGVADLLVSAGFEEGPGNTHKGQGTSNRRFYFCNGMLEFLWVHDTDEAVTGPGRELRLVERANDPAASPFGVILHRTDNASQEMPFAGWKYQPDYFDPPRAFHVGANSGNLAEPLCIYVPFMEPGFSLRKPAGDTNKQISCVKIHVPCDPADCVLGEVDAADRLSIECGDEHLMEVVLDDNRCGQSKDFRPDIALIIHQ
jgi:hypothetical protein